MIHQFCGVFSPWGIFLFMQQLLAWMTVCTYPPLKYKIWYQYVHSAIPLIPSSHRMRKMPIHLRGVILPDFSGFPGFFKPISRILLIFSLFREYFSQFPVFLGYFARCQSHLCLLQIYPMVKIHNGVCYIHMFQLCIKGNFVHIMSAILISMIYLFLLWQIWWCQII